MADGRPHSPTLHPNTKAEASEYALRNRGTSDWYRHDGKNVEEPAQPPVRLSGQSAQDNAHKSKGDADQWYQHKADNETDPAPVPRLKTDSAREVQDKVQGKEEKWMSQEDNRDYVSPRGQRLPDVGPSITFKEKFTAQTSMNWYRHDEGPKPQVSEQVPTPSKSTTCKKTVQQPETGTWFSHDPNNARPDARPMSRTSHNVDAEGYLARNQKGSATSWYGHDSTTSELQAPGGVRIASKEGGDIARKLGKESENWYSHDGKRDAPSPGKKGSMESQAQVERARGGAMAATITMEPPATQATSNGRVQPNAQETAKKKKVPTATLR